MNALFIHSNKMHFKALKKTKAAEEITKELEEKKVGECLVCFMAFEKADEGMEEKIGKEFAKNAAEIAEQVKVKAIVLYPFVHLLFGKEPSGMKTALDIINFSQKELLKEFEVIRSPFGYYKSFELECKGHPLAELSRVISAESIGKEKEESQALEAEKSLKSEWFILDKGKFNKIEINNGKISGYDFKGNENLEKFAMYEMKKVRVSTEEPAHVELMKKLQLADYEPCSDPGHLRYPPKGKLIRKLIEELGENAMSDYGAMEIETPIMYDFEHPCMKSYLQRFPAKQYLLQSPNKKLFLRFSSCFGQFLLVHDSMISYKQLPFSIYELAKSFRVEKRGELTGLRRFRGFTMPDCHAFCADIEQAKKELLKRFEVAFKLQKEIGFNLPKEMELAIRVVKPFFEKNKECVLELQKKWGRPALIEFWDEQFFYFVLKYEFNFVDALNKASALTTDQVDVENGKNYDLNYITEKGEKAHPIILHMSPQGATGRVMYALLERAHLQKLKGKNSMLPLWLAPTQIRICPVSEKFVKNGIALAEKFSKEKIRADVDDREESIGKKIRDSEMEWVPFTIVVGEKELKSKTLNVRIREQNTQKEMNEKQLTDLIKKETENLPFKALPLPMLLSKRPKF